MATAPPKRDSMDAITPSLTTKLANTHVSPSPSTNPKPTLATLPTAIRNKIYAHVLDTELVNHGAGNVSYTHTLRNGILHFQSSRPPFPVCTSLFLVCKQLSRESLHYFYSQNLFVRFALYTEDARHAKTMLEDSGLLFSVAEPEMVARCQRHAMDLTIVEKESGQRRVLVLFPAQYLPRLVNFLDQAGRAAGTWAKGHAVSFSVLNMYDFPVARLQGDLLELFRLLTNLGRVSVEGKELLPLYAEGLRESMMAAEFTVAGFLETLTTMADRAGEARDKGDWGLVEQLAQSCIIALTYAFLTRAEALHSQGEDVFRDIQRLRWRCDMGVSKALFEKHQQASGDGKWVSMPFSTPSEEDKEKTKNIAKDLLAVETAASQALSLATDSPNPDANPWFQTLPAEVIPPNKPAWFSDEERGMAWHMCGLVHMALGEYLFAAGDMERACGLYPGGDGFEETFSRAREAIDWNVKPGTGMKRAVRLARG